MKPITLKWEGSQFNNGDEYWDAQTPLGKISIFPVGGSDLAKRYRWNTTEENNDSVDQLEGFSPSADQAKADAQAAWDKLIMSCLEPA